MSDLFSRSQCTLAVIAAALTLPSGALLNNRAIALNPVNGKVYAVNESLGSVSIIDPEGRAENVKVGNGPDALAINTATGQVYVANASDGTLSVLDGGKNSVVATVKAGAHPYTLAVNEATNKVYVTNTFSDAIAVIDGATDTTKFLKIGSADNIAVDPKTNRVFMIGYEDPNLRILNADTEVVAKSVSNEHLWAMDFNPVTETVYLTGAGSSNVFAIDRSGRKTMIAAGEIPCAIAVNPNTNRIYVVNYAGSTVTVIDGIENKAIASVAVGKGPQAIVVDRKTNRIYVANTHANSVTVIDGDRNLAVATIPAGLNPFAITTSLNPTKIYVANLGQPSFTVINVGSK